VSKAWVLDDASTINSFLWPYALRKGAIVFNIIKKKNEELSPLERFSNVKVQFQPQHHHSFGCPMYVLDARLQSGSKVDKWEAQSRLTIFLGSSMNHAANVGLALSMTTGLVLPVFHAKYDNQFETVAPTYGQYLPKSQWQVRCGFIDESALETPNVPDQFLDNQQVATEQDNVSSTSNTNDTVINNNVPNTTGIAAETEGVIIHPVPATTNVEAPTQHQTITNAQMPNSNCNNNIAVPTPTVRQTRSGRNVRPPSYLNDYVSLDASIIDDTSNDFTNGIDPVALMMRTSQDTLYFHEILREPDKMEFVKAMREEICNHNKNKNWVPVKQKDIPQGHKVIPSVWAMRRKRRLVDGTVSKWKARLNVDGSKQVHGMNYWETYAPVAQWISI
jgi:hypothetical protein